jgi:c(7)-type cytochrome triheme protein
MVVVMVAVAAEAPDKIVFDSKMGNVTYDHKKHTEREKEDCKVCHDKLFPQSRAPINFKAGMHKPAEAAKTACAGCHHPGGKAFESKANCTKCHVKGAAAPKA